MFPRYFKAGRDRRFDYRLGWIAYSDNEITGVREDGTRYISGLDLYDLLSLDTKEISPEEAALLFGRLV